jgi:ABC-type oligopeptide transport system, periplasmic component
MKKLALLLVALMLLPAVLAGCGGKPIDTLSVCIGPNPDTIDPALNSAVDGATLIIHAFEGLYTLDEDGVPIPGQAKSVDISDDGLTYTFHLRDGLKWNDGTALKASDFVYSWNRAISPDTAADYAYMFDVIAGYDEGTLNVTATDDQTLVVVLKNITPYFLELTAFPTFSPVRQDIIEANGDAWATTPATYISNGPYKMSEWVSGGYITYVKNEYYWDYSKLGPDTIKFVLSDDDGAILSMYQTGEILFADSMPTDEIDAWSSKADFHKNGQLGTYYVSFNTKKAPLDNINVRKALTLAVDREYIVDNIGKAGQVPAGAFVSTGLTDSDTSKQFRDVGGDYYDPNDYEGNVELAKQALTDAGYTDGQGLPTIEYIYNEGTGHQLIAEALQNMWSKIGVNVTITSQEWSTFLNTRKDGEYQIARNGWLCDYNDPITMLDMWVTGGGNNDAQWSNADYDTLITKIKSTSDQTERFKMMHQAEDLIFQDWMLCPIYYYVDIYLQSTSLEGVWASPLGYKYFMYATTK